jgi:hypothetical protein
MLDERAVVEHIRRNGYIGQETLGDVCPNWCPGGGYPGPENANSLVSKDYERIRAANKLRLKKPPKPKYEPMF